MTRVIYRETREFSEMRLTGHAETVAPGQVSAVCAGISAISGTLWENLQREETAGQIRAEGEAPEPGEMRMKAYVTDENRDAIRNMFRFTLTGLAAVMRDYPGHIIIEEERGNGTV